MKPYYDHHGITIYHGDCLEILPSLPKSDVVIADPPYGETRLKWDVSTDEWIPLVKADQLWCFGSFRSFLEQRINGWHHVQEIIWEKHNGSSNHNDRFRRVHELVVHLLRDGVPWDSVYHQPVFSDDALRRTIRRKQRPKHWGRIDPSEFRSEEGGPRLMRSVIYARSCHGKAINPTQKPEAIIAPLVEYSCPPNGMIVDPFMGSGTTLAVAKVLGRRAIGIEKLEDYCEAAAKRLAQEVFTFAGSNQARKQGQK